MLAPQHKRQIERQWEWYEDARHVLTVLQRARPVLERQKGVFYLTVSNGEEYTRLALDGSGQFTMKEADNG